MDEEALSRELLVTYRAEARERLASITRLLLELEQDRSGAGVAARLEQIYREVHSLKGAARSIAQMAVEQAAHAFEDLLAQARGHEAVEDLALQAWYAHLDRLSLLVEAAPAGAGSVLATGIDPPVASPVDESVRVATPRLDRLMADVGTLLVSEQVDREVARRLFELTQEPSAAPGLGEDAAFRERLLTHVQALRRQRAEVRRQLQTLDGDIQALRMMPARSLFRPFARMVRDLAHEAGKTIELVVEGEETELDKAVLDGMRDPLVHLLRNAIDHGLETTAEREAAGKPAAGQLHLSAARQGSSIVIRLADDGRGIDRAALRAHAARLGIEMPSAGPSGDDREVLELLFKSGFSTRGEVSEVSGRGLGLAIVRQACQRLGGTVEIESATAGRGTIFALTVPLTLATTRCLLLEVGEEVYALPLETIHRTAAITRAAIASVQGQPAIRFDDRPARFFHLSALLYGRAAAAPERLPVVIFETPAGRVAVAGDRLRGEQELVVKRFPTGLPPVKHLAGAAMMATGEVALVVDPPALLHHALHPQAAVPGLAALPAPAQPQTGPARVLVVDDSITTRTLERNILQAAGYQVAVAPDGAQAWTMLQAEPFHLLVSDVQMPNLDGIALTERIRAHPQLRSLPVILVTARAEADDRLRGLQAGADAYIAKRDFRQTDLLETVDRLLGGRGAAGLRESA